MNHVLFVKVESFSIINLVVKNLFLCLLLDVGEILFGALYNYQINEILVTSHDVKIS